MKDEMILKRKRATEKINITILNLLNNKFVEETRKDEYYIAYNLSLSLTSTKDKLMRLLSVDLVGRKKNGAKYIYFLTEEGKKEIERYKIQKEVSETKSLEFKELMETGDIFDIK